MGVPSVLLDAAEDPLADELGIVLEYIEALPPDLRADFKDYFETVHVGSLRSICTGLRKLRQHTLPSEDELDLIAHRPQDVFRELAEGLESTALAASIPLDLAQSIETQIVAPLRAAAKSFLPGAAAGIVTWWFEELQDDPDGPFRDSPQP